jgi:hypothetical protein
VGLARSNEGRVALGAQGGLVDARPRSMPAGDDGP